MAKFLHIADLHLSTGERDYSLAVLEEIVSLAGEREVAYLLMAGDIFNSFEDAESLRTEFRTIIERLPPYCEALFLPGNHETLGRGKGELGSLDLGRVTLLEEEPFSLVSGEGVEFLALPHQKDYRDYQKWQVPPRGNVPRIALAHGVVPGLSFSGPDDETGGAVLDPDIFSRFQVDYAALGHIHSGRQERLGDTLLAYPGSARVWRRGELGCRSALLCDLKEKPLTTEKVCLKTAGRYLEYTLALSLEGEAEDLDREAAAWQGPDWITLRFSGLVENEKSVSELDRTFRRRFEKRVRKLDIERDSVTVLPGISSQPLAKKFLTLWKSLEPDSHQGHDSLVWHRVRELALAEIKETLESRK
ncbi:MAG TPA: DNA repair exonuclease [Spirochaetia bacterium]|nr:DNA repair exonuclease [Spirochaetia bacterium]